jgi:hypothetical protein
MNWILCIVSPLILVFGSILTLLIISTLERRREREEKRREREEKLKDDLQKICPDILEPFENLFYDPRDTNEVLRKISSDEYKKTADLFRIIAPDEAFNVFKKILIQLYEPELNTKNNHEELLRMVGGLYLEIRKSLGNEKTEIEVSDMVTVGRCINGIKRLKSEKSSGARYRDYTKVKI